MKSYILTSSKEREPLMKRGSPQRGHQVLHPRYHNARTRRGLGQRLNVVGSWDSLLVRMLDSRSKGCEFEFRQERRENFLLLGQLCVLTLIRCPFHPRVTAMGRKRPRIFCKKCRWQVTPKHAYTLDPTKSEWADYAAVQA